MKINSKGEYVLVTCPNPSMDILATIDSLQPGVPNRISDEHRYPGGKGIHVAMALAELGIEVVVAGLWGGATGQWIREECLRYYPGIRFIGSEITEWSRSCYTFKTNDNYDDTEILGPGPRLTADVMKGYSNIISEHLTSATALVLSGSWPEGADKDGYRDLISLANQASVPTFLDCTGIQLEQALNENPFCVHLNRKEITEHFKLDFEEASLALLTHSEVAAITDGSRGLFLSTSERAIHSLAKVDQVMSTVGSGDCLMAGVVAGYVLNMTLDQTAKYAASCGAANCLRPELGMLYKADVTRLMEYSS